MRFSVAVLTLALLGQSACSVTESIAPDLATPSFAKAAQPLSTDWAIDNTIAGAAVLNDGHGTYSDGQCGVLAVVYPSALQNGNMQPAASRSSCGYVRSVSVNLGSFGTASPQGMTAIYLYAIQPTPTGGPGSGAIDFIINGTGSGCAFIKYDNEPGSAQAAVTVTVSGGKRTWVIQSAGSAQCYVSSKNTHVPVGSVPAPFRVTVTEH